MENEFAKMRQAATEAVELYRKMRKVCNIADDEYHSRSIERLAKPFTTGYFTFAVVGKVSSGKSTFINALLGCKDLLPTGHDQTTCGLTYIQYGETPKARIKFGDGHTENIEGDDIFGKIKPHVAIPAEFHDLPVNNIDEMILADYGFQQIWDVHDQLEKNTHCVPIDENLLRRYVAQRSKSHIATEVSIEYPISEDLKTWRIVDTPGIGAIGGIEQKTKILLDKQKKENGAREVDAIIFLQDGSQTLDQTDSVKFVSEVLANLSEEDKRRLFYVLTHSADMDFLNHKEEKLKTLKSHYGDKVKFLSYADGLLFQFLNEIRQSPDIDLKSYDDNDKPSNWNDEEWDAVCGILFHAKRTLKKQNMSFNNETMREIVTEWAHLDELKEEINKFARKEKTESFLELMNMIDRDFGGVKKKLSDDADLVKGGLEKIKEKQKEIVVS